jgi:hypothetical protein
VIGEPVQEEIMRKDVVEWTDSTGATYRGRVYSKEPLKYLKVWHKIKKAGKWVWAETIVSEHMCRLIPPEEL